MKRIVGLGLCLLALTLALSGCQGTAKPTDPGLGTQEMEIESSAFGPETVIPTKYTCDGQNISPPLSWGEPPPTTKSLTLIMDDADAPGGTFVHWVLYDLPDTTRSLPEAVPTGLSNPEGVQGVNGAKTVGYTGPCPPKGSSHNYIFRIYALDTTLNLDPGASKSQVDQAMVGHILAEGQLVGVYGR